jgi:putative peptidoglycan lipid II flippase
MGFLRSATVVSASTLVSRILGMVRDIICASLLGAGPVWDAFVVAWRIPNLFRRLLGEGALSSAFIPVFLGEKEKAGLPAALRFFGNVLGALSLLLAVITVLGVAFTVLVPGTWFGDGAEADKAQLALDLLRILFPYMFLINLMALFMAVLNSLGHFFAPAIAPALLNVFWIAGALLAPVVAEEAGDQVQIVALFILVGGVAQFAVQLPVLRRFKVPLRPHISFRDPALRRLLFLMFPMVLGLAPMQVNILLDTLIAEACVPGDGANSYLFYGNRLMQFPLALVGIAMAVVVFPVFSAHAKAGRREELGQTLSEALRTTFFLALPAAAGLFVLASPLIALIYEHGVFRFDPDTPATARVLRMYALGVPAVCGLQVLTRLFYSLEEVKTPVRVGAAMVMVNLVLNLILVFPLRESGLALATSLSATLNLVILGFLAHRRLGIRGLRRVSLSFLRSLIFTLLMGGAVFWLSHALSRAFPEREILPKLLWVLPPTLLGAVLYLGVSFGFGVPEARKLLVRTRKSPERTAGTGSDTDG